MPSLRLCILRIKHTYVFPKLPNPVFKRYAVQMLSDLFFRTDISFDGDSRLFPNLLENLSKRRLIGNKRQITITDIHLKYSCWRGFNLFGLLSALSEQYPPNK